MNQRRGLLGGAAVIATAVVTFSGSAAYGQSIMLKPESEKGQKRYVERMSTATQAQGRNKIKINRVAGVVEEVLETSDEGTRFRLTLDREAFSMGGPGAGSFDTDLPDGGQTAAWAVIFRPMIGVQMTMVVSPDLKVKSFKGVKALVKKVDKSAADNPLWGQFRDNTNSAEYKASWGNSRLVLFPNKEVKEGDTWKGSFTQSDASLGELKNEYECKLDGITEKNGGKEATISYKLVVTKLRGPKKGKKGDAGTVEFKSSAAEGTAVFDSTQGCFVKMTEKGTTELELTMMGKQVPLTVTSDEKLSVISVEAREQSKAKRQQSAGKEPEKKDEKKDEKKPPAP
jgi:hypothetical protein